MGEPTSQTTAETRPVKNRINWTPEGGLVPEYTGHEMDKHRALMERQRERREQEMMMMQRGDLKVHWQPATAHNRREKDKVGFSTNSNSDLEEWARRRHYHSHLRRRRLQGEMWREIQDALKMERISGSFSTKSTQKSGVNISENLPMSHQPPPYTSVRHDTFGKMFNKQDQSKFLSSSRSPPPKYTPPPLYTPRPNRKNLTGRLEPERSFQNFSIKYRFGSRPNKRQTEHRSVTFSDGRHRIKCSSGDGTQGRTIPGTKTTQHQEKHWPFGHQEVKNQQQVFPPQSAGHHHNYQTLYYDKTLNKPKRRRSGGTVFCLVTHMGELASSANDAEPQCQSLPLLKASTFRESQKQAQLANEAGSCQSLNYFSLDCTLKEPKEEHKNLSEQNERFFKHKEELKIDREEARKMITEKSKDSADSIKDSNKIIPAAPSKSTTPVEPHYPTTLKFPVWKEPKSHHSSNGFLKKTKNPIRSISDEGQYEQPELRNNTMTSENTGLVIIDATCVVIKVEFIIPPEKEHVQYVCSGPTDSSEQNSGSNPDHRTTDQTTGKCPVQKVSNQTNHTFGQVQSKAETLTERAERILGIVPQNSVSETLKETTQLENSIQKVYAEESAGAETGYETRQIPITSSQTKEDPPQSTKRPKAMPEISEVTHGDAVDLHTEFKIMAMKTAEQQRSVDRKFILEENNPTACKNIDVEQVKNSAEGSPTVENDDLQNLTQTILRNTTKTSCQECNRREDNLLHEIDEKQDYNQIPLGRCNESANKMFSLEDGPTEGNSSDIKGENFHDSQPKTGELEYGHPEENPPIIFHNLQKSDLFSLDHHQENLLHLQNICPNLLNTSETFHQESSPNQNLPYSTDPQVCPPSLGHGGENTNELFAHEKHLSDIWPNLLTSSVLNINETIVKDLLREEIPSHANHANHFHQTLPGNNMENTSKPCDLEEALTEENILSCVNNLYPYFSGVLCDEDGVENLSSELIGEHVVYCQNKGNQLETINIKSFSLSPFRNIEEHLESSDQEASSEEDIILDELQNICPILCTGSIEESLERVDNEGITTPSHDLHILSAEGLTPSLLSSSHFSHLPDSLLDEVTCVNAQMCSPEQDHLRVKESPQSLWDAVSRIRKHTAPDSETEDEDGEISKPVKNPDDYLFSLYKINKEKTELKRRSDHARRNISDVVKALSEEEKRHVGEKKGDDDDDDDDDSVSSSSLDSQDTVIEGGGKKNILESDEEEKKQESDIFSENKE